jgi:hypothetical protein
LLRYKANTMLTKFTVVLTILFLGMTSINADKVRGLRSGPPGHGGYFSERFILLLLTGPVTSRNHSELLIEARPESWFGLGQQRQKQTLSSSTAHYL